MELKRSWSNIGIDILETMVRKIITPINQSIKSQTDSIIRRFSGTITLIAGGIFFLQAAAILISEYSGRPLWFGLLAVAFPLMIVGLLLIFESVNT